MRGLIAGLILGAALGSALLAVEIAPGRSEPPAAVEQRAPAQARTLIKYIASGSIDVAAALPGVRELAGGLAVDQSGNLYVAFTNASRAVEVAVLSPDGRLLRRWDPTGGATVGNPTLLAVGPDGLVYLRNRNERIIRVFTTTGAPVRTFGGSLSPNNTGDLEVDSAGNVYTIDLDKIVKFNAVGAVTGSFTPIPGIHADRLLGLAVAADGSLYVTVDPRLTGLPQEPPFLVHLDASGQRLADPAPLLNRLMNARGTRSRSYVARDIDFANGRLYIAQETGFSALGVITPSGELVDAVGSGSGQQVAVRGDSVHVTGLTNRRTARTTAQSELSIGQLKEVDVFIAAPPGSFSAVECGSRVGPSSLSGASQPGTIPTIIWRGDNPNCRAWFINKGSPCGSNDIQTPRKVFLGGEQVDVDIQYFREREQLQFPFSANQVSSGQVVVEWSCVDKTTNEIEVKYEWKGGISVLIDPSGNVFDAKTGRAIAGATVRLQFSPQKGGPFGTPSANAYTPQIHPQTTGGDGFFGWDVAEGFWRLQITAFGYKRFTSTVYKVPPEVKGLKLKLQPDPRQQARVIDPHAGRAGSVRVGAKLKTRRIAGLRLKILRGKVRSITVRSRAYRTVLGVRLGSPSTDLLQAYPARARTAITRLLTSRKPVQHRVGKAMFTVRRGRVVAIALGR